MNFFYLKAMLASADENLNIPVIKPEPVDKAVEDGFNIIGKTLEYLVSLIPNLITGIIFALIGYLIARVIRFITEKLMDKSKLSKSLTSFLSQIIYAIAIIFVIIMALGVAGVPITAFAAALGGLGVAIGLGFKDSMANFSSGILILIQNPYRIGDYVTTQEGYEGTVSNIKLMSTSLYTLDGKTVHVPNSLMTSETVVNYSQNPVRTLRTLVTISYDSNYEKALEILKNIYEESGYLFNEENTKYKINSLQNGVIELLASGMVKSPDYMEFFYHVNKEILKKFNENGICLAAPSCRGTLKI